MLDNSYVIGSDDDVLYKLGTSRTGLTDVEAEKRLKKYGHNKLDHEENTWVSILVRQLSSSFVYLLLAAAGISLFLGEQLDALLIFIFLFINTVLGFYQEYRSEQTLKLLGKFIRSSVTVLRGEVQKPLSVEYLVPGDLILVQAGDQIPADIRFIDAHGLSIDESILTGESAPLGKIHEGSHKLNDPINIGFSGTTVVSGKATGVVIGTGQTTEYAQIAKLVGKTVKKSIFEREIDAISKFTLILVSVTLAFFFLVHIGLNPEAEIARLALFSVALAVSVIPEALPLVTTFSLSIGAMRLAKQKVVVKRLSAIEDLGSIEVLCSDKTGTLTENKLTLNGYYGRDRDTVVFYQALAIPDAGNTHRDPFDVAILSGVPQYQSFDENNILSSLPFDPNHKRTTTLVRVRDSFELVSRGAPESIIALTRGLRDQDKKQILQWVLEQGQDGKRVLAVARKKLTSKVDDLRKHEVDMEFVGMLSFIDPIKPTTQKAIDDAKELGVSIKILTGDSRDVAAAVAMQIGLIDDTKNVITGNEYQALSHREKEKAVIHYNVFARVTPAQKHEIISLLEDDYEVGFLGEGINDAPALKVANVAIAVDSAADIAKEASDIVLLEKSLDVIVNGIRQGRSVFVNTTKYITATLSANFGNFFAIALVSIVLISFEDPFLPMLPLQILLLNLLSDFPMIAVATDSVDTVEIHKPQRYNIKSFAVYALLLGVVSTVFDFLFFAVFVGRGESVLHTGWFMGSVLTELAFLFSVRTRKFIFHGTRPSTILIVLSVFAALTAIAIPLTSLGQQLFMFQRPTLIDFGLIGAILVLYICATEGMKALYYHTRFNLKQATRRK